MAGRLAVGHFDIGFLVGDATVGGADDPAAFEVELLVAVGAPAHDTRHCEERRVDLAGDADHIIDETGIEVDIGAKRLVLPFHGVDGLDGHLLDQFHERQLVLAALLLRELAGHLLEQDGARVGLRVNGMTDAIHETGVVEGAAGEQLAHAGGDLGFARPVLDLLLHEGDHVADLEVGAAVLGALQGPDARGDGRKRVRAGRRSHAHGEGGVVTAAVLGVQDQQHVERAGVQLRVVGSLQHIEEILRQRQARLGVADVQGTAVVVVPVHIVRVGDRGRELRDQLDALAHQVVARHVVRILVEGVELHHAAREDVHDVVALQLDDVQDGLLLQRHIVEVAQMGSYAITRFLSSVLAALKSAQN